MDYYDNGQLNKKGEYNNGLKEGLWVHYTSDGSVDEELTGTFKNGLKVD